VHNFILRFDVDASLLAQAAQDIQPYFTFPGSNFKPRWLLIVTWSNVIYSSPQTSQQTAPVGHIRSLFICFKLKKLHYESDVNHHTKTAKIKVNVAILTCHPDPMT
jgi:hypothetical protein